MLFQDNKKSQQSPVEVFYVNIKTSKLRVVSQFDFFNALPGMYNVVSLLLNLIIWQR
jgi:hypothetical protein